MITIKEIKRLMNEQAWQVVEYLLPEGKRRGHEWVVGSADGEPGDSMRICMEGDKFSVWKDFADPDRGGKNFLNLWMEVRRVDIHTAIKEIKQFLGIKDVDRFLDDNKFYSRPKPVGVELKENAEAEIYLMFDRKLNASTIDKFQVRATGSDIIFPYYRDGELINQKYLGIDRVDGKKKIRADKNCEPCLFGWHAINPDAESIVICEGEIDAMTLHQYGFNALSVPLGAGTGSKHDWLTNDFIRLSIYDEIFLCFDNDEPGKKAVDQIIPKLGAHRCKVVKLPYKDANECLLNNMTADEMKAFFNSAETKDPTILKNSLEFLQRTKDAINGVGDDGKFISLPFKKLDGKISFRPGQLSVWTGFNGHGKTDMLGQIIIDSINQGSRVCMASLEIPPHQFLKRMVSQAGAISDPTDEYTDAIFNWWRDNLWIINVVDTIDPDLLLEVFLYARQRYDVDTFVIDSFLKCGVSDEQINDQKVFVDRLCNFKNTHGCHIHLIAHPKKVETDKPPGKYDIKGSSAVSDLADNCFSVFRNRKKEEMQAKADAGVEPLPPDFDSMPDTILKCDKNRYNSWEGAINLWYDLGCYQFLNSQDAKPKCYVPFSILTKEEI